MQALDFTVTVLYYIDVEVHEICLWVKICRSQCSIFSSISLFASIRNGENFLVHVIEPLGDFPRQLDMAFIVLTYRNKM